MKIKIGKGRGHSYTLSFGTLTAKIGRKMENMTLKQIALNLARQGKIKDGEVDLIGVEFNYAKRMTNEESSKKLEGQGVFRRK